MQLRRRLFSSSSQADAAVRLAELRRTTDAQEAATRKQAEASIQRALAASAKRVADAAKAAEANVKATKAGTDAQLARLHTLESQLAASHAAAQAESARSASRLLAKRAEFERQLNRLNSQQQDAMLKVTSIGQTAINAAQARFVAHVAQMKAATDARQRKIEVAAEQAIVKANARAAERQKAINANLEASVAKLRSAHDAAVAKVRPLVGVATRRVTSPRPSVRIPSHAGERQVRRRLCQAAQHDGRQGGKACQAQARR